MKTVKTFKILFPIILSVILICSCSSFPLLNGNGENSSPAPKEHTVSFHTGFDLGIDDLTVKHGERVKEPYITSRKGAIFKGWFLDETEWDFANNEVSEDITLTAKWELIEYTINYDLGGGSYDGEMPEMYTVESPTLTLGTPTREGYLFMGWTINNSDTSEIKTGSTGDKSIKAKWFGTEAAVLPVKDGARGIVCLIHDDARLATMEIMDGLLVKHGLVGDVGFLLNKVYDGYSVNYGAVYNYTGFLNNGRWKIVNHSATHQWWGNEVDIGLGSLVPVVDNERLIYELGTSQEKMRELFPGQRVLTFAYPGFSGITNKYTDNSKEQLQSLIYTPYTRSFIQKNYIGARFYNGGATLIGDGNVDWSWLSASFLSASFIENRLESTLDKAVKNGTLNLLSFHALTTDPEQPVKDQGYSILDTNMDKAMAMIKEYVDAGLIWNTHFEDAVLYLREAETATVTVKKNGEKTIIILTDEMDDEIYDAPLTVRVTNLGDTDSYEVNVNGEIEVVNIKTVDGVRVLDINIVPDGKEVIITPLAN